MILTKFLTAGASALAIAALTACSSTPKSYSLESVSDSMKAPLVNVPAEEALAAELLSFSAEPEFPLPTPTRQNTNPGQKFVVEGPAQDTEDSAIVQQRWYGGLYGYSFDEFYGSTTDYAFGFGTYMLNPDGFGPFMDLVFAGTSTDQYSNEEVDSTLIDWTFGGRRSFSVGEGSFVPFVDFGANLVLASLDYTFSNSTTYFTDSMLSASLGFVVGGGFDWRFSDGIGLFLDYRLRWGTTIEPEGTYVYLIEQNLDYSRSCIGLSFSN